MTRDLTAAYAAAEKLLPHRLRSLVKRGNVVPRWDGDLFRYTVTGDRGPEHVEVDCLCWTRTPVDATVPEFASHESPSPDRKKVAFLRGHDVWVRDVATGNEHALTTDGTPDRPYGIGPDVADLRVMLGVYGLAAPPLVVWSPDSARLVTHRLDQSELELMPLVQASPPDGSRPRLRSYRYAMVGDPIISTATLVVLDAADGPRVDVDLVVSVPFMSPLMLKHLWWSPDSQTCFLAHSDRNSSTVNLHRIDPSTGLAEQLVRETGATQVQLAPMFTGLNVRVLRSGEVLWWSERSGWGHLYLYATDGSCRTVTSGEWLVRDLVAVDEDARLVWFTGAGREPGSDPYVRQLYRVGLDDGAVERLTDDDLDHQVSASPTGRYAVDVASSISQPARSVLRRLASDEVLELEVADATDLYAAGWQAPERFQVLAADGATPLFGLLYKPHGFDPAVSYPVLDEIYPGPQINAATSRFPGSGGAVGAAHAAEMAALGFAVVVVDGRGTPLRNKAFQDSTRKGRDILLDDHRAATEQLAATRPWMDLTRVGIYGISGGGQMSTRALLLHPDLYKVAVSAAGDHDDATYHAAWGERFFGSPEQFDYTAASNATLAHRLEGRLLLIHGDQDDNVTPHHTLRLVDALMAADRDVDLLIVPNANHALNNHQAHWLRRRWDYFVRHLMGQEPPAYHLAPIPLDPTALLEMTG